MNHCEHHRPDPCCGHGHLAEFEPGWRLIRMELKAHLPFTVAVSILTLMGAYLAAANVEFRGNPAPAGSDQHVAGRWRQCRLADITSALDRALARN